MRLFEKVDIKEQTGYKGESLKRCKIINANSDKCRALYINNGSTGNTINHLLNKYKISREGKRDNVSIFINFFLYLLVKYLN